VTTPENTVLDTHELHQQIRDYLFFSLSPYLHKREIELITLRLLQKKGRPQDTTYQNCFYHRLALDKITKSKKKQPLYIRQNDSEAAQMYCALTQLAPDDLLILLSMLRYKIPIMILSMILNKPEESIQFRYQQLLQQLTTESATFDPTAIQNLEIHQLISEESSTMKSTHFNIKGQSKIPTPLKFFFEMASVFALLFALMWLIPELRSAYESSIQKQINSYLIEKTLLDSPVPPELSVPKPITPLEETEADSDTLEDQNAVGAVIPTKKQPKVKEGETWRFSFAGQGFPDLEALIAEIVAKQKGGETIKSDLVPGGNQFDFFLPVADVIPLKTSLEQIAFKLNRKLERSSNLEAGSANYLNLSWYKKRNMGTRKIPNAHVQVFIWISTL
jgi:hypothetical protein